MQHFLPVIFVNKNCFTSHITHNYRTRRTENFNFIAHRPVKQFKVMNSKVVANFIQRNILVELRETQFSVSLITHWIFTDINYVAFSLQSSSYPPGIAKEIRLKESLVSFPTASHSFSRFSPVIPPQVHAIIFPPCLDLTLTLPFYNDIIAHSYKSKKF